MYLLWCLAGPGDKVLYTVEAKPLETCHTHRENGLIGVVATATLLLPKVC